MSSMRLLLFSLFAVCLTAFAVFSASAQPAGFTLLANTVSLQQQLSSATHATHSISSDFNQIKHMKMLNDKVSSKGKFYFKKENKIRIEYTAPFQYLMIMNGGTITVKDEHKTSKINTRNSKAMQSANKLMIDCMSGSVYNNKDFSVKTFEGKGQYLMQLTPVAASMKGLFSRIDVYIEKSDLSVAKLVMNEQGGDYTEMTFINKKKNQALSDALFTVR
jgi:outer membrane lipoprotein-sorting protein